MERYQFDFKKLMDYGIVYITQAHDLSTGEKIPPDYDPETGEYYEDSTNLITLYNIKNPEQGTQDHLLIALRNLRPDQAESWTENQENLTRAKYNQILWGINEKNMRPEDFKADAPAEEAQRISDIVSGQDAYKQTTGTDTSMQDSMRFPYHESFYKLRNLVLEIKDKTIECEDCGWKWKRSEGGKDPYVCHKCGHDNSED